MKRTMAIGHGYDHAHGHRPWSDPCPSGGGQRSAQPNLSRTAGGQLGMVLEGFLEVLGGFCMGESQEGPGRFREGYDRF